MIPKNPRIELPKYLAWIRKQRCACCASDVGVQPHHLIGYGNGGMGTKAPDFFAIPMCAVCHRELHDANGEDRTHWIFAQFKWLERTLADAIRDGVVKFK